MMMMMIIIIYYYYYYYYHYYTIQLFESFVTPFRFVSDTSKWSLWALITAPIDFFFKGGEGGGGET